MKRRYYTRVRRRGTDWVAAPELHDTDLALLFRALTAYTEALDSETLTAQTDEERDQLFYEKRDTKELVEWLQNSSDELWRYTDADTWTTCERCGRMDIPIVEGGAPEFCDDCASMEVEV